MGGLELCQECKGLHYKNAPCIVRGTKSTAARKDAQRGLASKDVRDNSTARVGGSLQGRHLNREAHKPQAGTQVLPVDTNIPKPKRSGNRHRPGYFTEYMRDYRKGIRRRKTDD